MNRYKEHQKLLQNVIKALQKKYPDMRIFQRHVGVFRYLRNNGIIKINKKGMADIWCLYQGRHIEIEIKTGNAKQTKDQKSWQKAILNCGAEYYVINSIEQIELIEF